MKMEIEEFNFDRFENLLKMLSDPKRSAQLMFSSLRYACKPVLERAKQLAPYKSGKLKEGLKLKRAPLNKTKKWLTMMLVGDPAAYYWRFIEFGTVNRAARPFLRPAVDEKKGEVASRFRASYMKKLKREIDKRGLSRAVRT